MRFAAAIAIAGALVTGGSATQSVPRKVTVEAERFNFTPSRIKVAVGEEIEIHLRSADTAHGFRVEGTDIDVAIPKRGKGEAIIRYTGAKTGRYMFECNRMCGAGHHFMRGELLVEERRE